MNYEVEILAIKISYYVVRQLDNMKLSYIPFEKIINHKNKLKLGCCVIDISKDYAKKLGWYTETYRS